MTINGYKYWSRLRPVGPFTYPSDARLLAFYNYESRTEYHGKTVWGWMRLDRAALLCAVHSGTDRISARRDFGGR